MSDRISDEQLAKWLGDPQPPGLIGHLFTYGDSSNLVLDLHDARARLKGAEAALEHIRILVHCDMGPECPRPEHWPDCAINVAAEIQRKALEEIR